MVSDVPREQSLHKGAGQRWSFIIHRTPGSREVPAEVQVRLSYYISESIDYTSFGMS